METSLKKLASARNWAEARAALSGLDKETAKKICGVSPDLARIKGEAKRRLLGMATSR